MGHDLVVANGLLVTPDGALRANLGIMRGRITRKMLEAERSTQRCAGLGISRARVRP